MWPFLILNTEKINATSAKKTRQGKKGQFNNFQNFQKFLVIYDTLSSITQTLDFNFSGSFWWFALISPVTDGNMSEIIT